VGALRALHRRHPGPLTVLGDRSRTHNPAQAVPHSLAQHPELVTDEFPGYAPELTPAEQVWAQLKSHALANYAPPDGATLRGRLLVESSHLQQRFDLLAAFIKHTNLPLRL
jgi:transposase